MINWPQYLLFKPAPALGWKRLAKRSASAQRFLEAHPHLRVTAEAKERGDFGWYVPNFADQAGRISLYASFYFLDELLSQAPQASVEVLKPEGDIAGVPDDASAVGVLGSGQEFGSKLENKIADGLREQIVADALPFEVSSKGSNSGAATSFRLTDYWPYAFAPAAQESADAQETYRRLGRGHLIQPDVLVWRAMEKPFSRVIDQSVETEAFTVQQLYACISGKATIRSDRSQSSRYEGSTISRWRRGRAPHFVVVTAEPSPARLGSLAWGLGEIDCVYHVSVSALYAALRHVEQDVSGGGSAKAEFASGELRELIEHARVRDLSLLYDDLFGEVARLT